MGFDDEDDFEPGVPLIGVSENSSDRKLDCVVQSYEDLCRIRLEMHDDGAEQYESESRLVKRVSEWQNRILPFLEREERRGAFDIKKYGNKIIESFEKDSGQQETNEDPASSTPLSFEKFVQGKESIEVCRDFVALLQLANVGNVALIHKDGIMNSLSVILRSRQSISVEKLKL